MWAPNSKNVFQIGSHVFTVEFHTYFYHLIDALPGTPATRRRAPSHLTRSRLQPPAHPHEEQEL